jgi:hypothetical protein
MLLIMNASLVNEDFERSQKIPDELVALNLSHALWLTKFQSK